MICHFETKRYVLGPARPSKFFVGRWMLKICVIFVTLLVLQPVSDVAAQSPKTVVGLTKNITDALGKAGDTAVKNKTFETIEKLDSIASRLSGLSSLGPPLALVGAALDIIKIIENKPDATAKILTAIDNLDQKIDETNKFIGDVEDRIISDVEYTAFRTDISARLSTIETSYDWWREINDPNVSEQIKLANRKKIESKIAEVQIDAKAISDHCGGANRAAPMFETLEAYSNGDITFASEWASLVMGRLTQATMVNAYFEATKSGSSLTESEAREILDGSGNGSISADFLGYLQICNRAFRAARNSLLRDEIVYSNASTYIDTMYEKGFTKAEEYGAALKNKFPYHDWVVAVYKPTGSYQNHYVYGTNFITRFRKAPLGFSQKDAVFHFYPAPRSIEQKISQSKKFDDLFSKTNEIADNVCEWRECWLHTRTAENYGFFIYCDYEKEVWFAAMQKCTETWNMPSRKYDLRLIMTTYAKSPFYLVGRISATGWPQIYRSDDETSGYAVGKDHPNQSLWTLQSN